MKHVPATYIPHAIAGATMWTVGARDAVVETALIDALAAIDALLAFPRKRALHVVVYASLGDAHAALDRDVPAATWMAPYHDADIAVIVTVEPAPALALRHVAHELAHVYAYERTGSTKQLGDGDVGMRIPPWLDEGFAECISAHVANRPDILARTPQRDVPDVDAALRDLASPLRRDAFAIATSRVASLIDRFGSRGVFEQLPALALIE